MKCELNEQETERANQWRLDKCGTKYPNMWEWVLDVDKNHQPHWVMQHVGIKEAFRDFVKEQERR